MIRAIVVFLASAAIAAGAYSYHSTDNAFEIASPTVTALSCAATLNTYKAMNGSLTVMSATMIPCRDGMVVRAIARGDLIVAYIDNVRYGFFDNAIGHGQSRFGRAAGAGG